VDADLTVGKNYLAWPVASFTQIFSGFGEKDYDDWKAVVYAFGGPKPSFIARTSISIVGTEVRLTFELEPGVCGGYRDNRVRWWRESVPGSSE